MGWIKRIRFNNRQLKQIIQKNHHNCFDYEILDEIAFQNRQKKRGNQQHQEYPAYEFRIRKGKNSITKYENKTEEGNEEKDQNEIII